MWESHRHHMVAFSFERIKILVFDVLQEFDQETWDMLEYDDGVD